MKKMTFALAGNPNSGKTTLFNALTGSNHHVGNWAGVTVEKKEGFYRHKDHQITLVDMPGTYSLSPYSIEEKVARDFILNEKPDMIINIVDASFLERNLFLTLQIIELGVPMVIALNMMDEAEKKGMIIDCEKLGKRLGVPVVPITAIRKDGIMLLNDTAVANAEAGLITNPGLVNYGSNLEKAIKKLQDEIESASHEKTFPVGNSRWGALKILENDEDIKEKLKGFNFKTNDDNEYQYELEITEKKYAFIGHVLKDVVFNPHHGYDKLSDRIDKLLLNEMVGLPVFAAIMYSMFYMTFNLGGIFTDLLDVFFNVTLADFVRNTLTSLHVASWMISMLVDGVIGGVGGILTFVPNIAILFLLISVLEDSGYMARAALLMDRVMTRVGLNGKNFIPMVLGFGCNVPGIMSTRTLENHDDRMIAILTNPFMSCSARFPVYVLFTSVFFPGNQTLVTFSLYILGIFMALLVSYVFRKTLFKGEQQPFIMELPPYRMPDAFTLMLHVWDKVSGYLVKAGTVIFGASVLLWLLLNFNFTGMVGITESFGATIGKVLAPILSPMGFGQWQAALSLLSGVAAKEIVVANMMIVYGLGESASSSQMAGLLGHAFTPLSAYAFMVFVLLYTPCVGVIGIIRRETGSWKWTWFSIGYQLIVAWVVSAMVYQLGHLLLGLV